MARLLDRRRSYLRTLVVGLAFAVYTLAFLLLYSRVGAAVGALSFGPVLLAAWLLGWRGGLAAALLSLGLNLFLFRGTDDWQPAGHILAMVMQAAAGLAAGLVRQLLDRLHVQVAERERAEASLAAIADALRASQERLRRQYKSNPVPVYSFRRSGDDYLLVDYNDAAERITGGAVAAVVGRRFGDVFDRADIQADFTRCLGEQRTVAREMPFRFNSSGETKHLAVTYVFVPPDGVLVYTEDMTDRKEAERQAAWLARSEKLRALGQMAGGVAHDLNQSLGMVVSYGEAARSALAAGDHVAADEMLAVVRQAALDGGESVRRLLMFARPTEERERQPVEMAALLRDVVQLTAPRWRDDARAEGREIEVRVDADPEAVASAFASMLRHALTNLLFNAVDALPDGGVISLTARRRDGRVEVEVADDGLGMPPEVQARVFEPFFTTKGERGSGLGLAQVFAIVERHGGTVRVSSAPGAGTTFVLTLPAAERAEAGSEATPAPSRGLRVLVVDDEVRLARAAALALGGVGHTVAVAESGPAALEQLAAAEFDVVVSDLGMEGMSGWELIAQVRRRWPDVGIVLATGWGAAVEPGEARERGVDRVVAKPYTREVLRAAVEGVAGRVMALR